MHFPTFITILLILAELIVVKFTEELYRTGLDSKNVNFIVMIKYIARIENMISMTFAITVFGFVDCSDLRRWVGIPWCESKA